MKIFGRIMTGIGVIISLLLLFILLCHLNPGLAEQIGSLLGQQETGETEAGESLPLDVAGEDILPEASDLTGDMLLEQITGIGEDNPETPEQQEPEVDYPIEAVDGIQADSVDTGYVPPEDSSLEIPQTVSGLTGYVPVTDTGEEITEPEAEAYKEELGYGNLGDGLTFDATMYPYYQMLNDTGKSLYRQIYANANDLTQAFVPVETTSQAVLKNAFSAVCNDHPELFWVDTAYTFQYTPAGTARMDLQFNQTANNLSRAQADFEASAEEILSAARNLGSDYEKEVQVHDDLIDGITYQLNATMNQSAYSALVNGRTVCAGYARAYQYLLQQLSIPCYYCTGYAGENHAWNIVQLEGDYYNVDPTWDDADPNNHDYFNCTDADFSKDHARKDLAVYLPPCNGEKYRNLIEDEEMDTDQERDASEEQDTSEEQTTSGEQTTSEEQSETQNDKVLTTISDYYQNCYDQAMETEGTIITFSNVIENRNLAREIYRSYQTGDYREAFMVKMMEEKGFTQSTIDLELQEQTDGTYLLNHTIRAS